MADKTEQSGRQRVRNPDFRKDRRQSGSSHSLKKRQPPRPHRAPNDFYITNKSNFKGQLKECEDLLNKGDKEIFLHGLGAAVRRTINLALQIHQKYAGIYQLDVKTHSVQIVDDFEPLNEEDDYETQIRMNSAIKIRIFKQDQPQQL